MRRGTPRDALARLHWKEHVPDWRKVRILVRHRGAPDDQREIGGEQITELGASFFEIDGETRIPYHRILRIRWEERVEFQRPSSERRP